MPRGSCWRRPCPLIGGGGDQTRGRPPGPATARPNAANPCDGRACALVSSSTPVAEAPALLTRSHSRPPSKSLPVPAAWRFRLDWEGAVGALPIGAALPEVGAPLRKTIRPASCGCVSALLVQRASDMSYIGLKVSRLRSISAVARLLKCRLHRVASPPATSGWPYPDGPSSKSMPSAASALAGHARSSHSGTTRPCFGSAASAAGRIFCVVCALSCLRAGLGEFDPDVPLKILLRSSTSSSLSAADVCGY